MEFLDEGLADLRQQASSQVALGAPGNRGQNRDRFDVARAEVVLRDDAHQRLITLEGADKIAAFVLVRRFLRVIDQKRFVLPTG
jgi:hypothetical protein